MLKDKIKLIKKSLPIIPYRFLNEIFALKKYHILQNGNLASNKIFSGINFLMNTFHISLILLVLLKYKIKNRVCNVKLEI